MKKLIPLIIIIAIIALGIGLYLGWQKAKPFLNPPTTPAPTPEEVLQQKIKSLSDKEVFDYWINSSATSTEIFYITLDGKIFNAETNEEISDQIINNLQQIKTSSDGSKILIKSVAATSTSFTIFNLETKIWQPLDNEIVAVDFSPTEDKIIYLMKTKTGASNLIIKDLEVKAKQKSTIIMSLNQQDFDINWIDKDLILLIPKPANQITSEVWQVNLKDKTIKLFASGNGLMLNWQKIKQRGLKSIISKDQLVTYLIDKNNQEQVFNFSTFPDKCTLDDFPQLYCAIAITTSISPQRLTLPDDYLKKAVYFNDILYKIDTASSTSTPEEILSSTDEAPIDIFNLRKIGNTLLFINRYDNKLYKIEI
jgi:hypothetical protein